MPVHHENNTHTHTHTYIYIYICVCVCVCVCARAKIQNFLMCKQAINLELPLLIYFKRRLHWYKKPVHFTHTVYSGVL